jgi:hypothetical protein
MTNTLEWDLAERLVSDCHAEVATVLGSIPESSDSTESEGQLMMKYWITYIKRKKFKYILQQEKVEILETETFAFQGIEQRLVEQRLKYPFFI